MSGSAHKHKEEKPEMAQYGASIYLILQPINCRDGQALSLQRLETDNCIAYQLMHQRNHIPSKLKVEVAGVTQPT